MSQPEDGRAEAFAFMAEREHRPAHVEHVAALALQLFDGLAALHGFGSHQRLLLEAAALLHDIGHHAVAVGGPSEGHHKESARLIRGRAWRHFAPADVEVVAQVARYHRKGMPEVEHDEFRALNEWDRRAVQSLAALLRLADAFDRTHLRSIQRVRVELRPNELVFHLDAVAPVLRELQAARLKGDLAQAVFQRDLVFVVLNILPSPPCPAGASITG